MVRISADAGGDAVLSGPTTKNGIDLLATAARFPVVGRLVTAEWVAAQERSGKKARLFEFAGVPQLVGVLNTYDAWLDVVERVDPSKVSEYWSRLKADRRTHDGATAELALLFHLTAAGFALRFWADGKGPEWVGEKDGRTLAIEVKRYAPDQVYEGGGFRTGTVAHAISRVVEKVEERRKGAKRQLKRASHATARCLGVDLTEQLDFHVLRSPEIEAELRRDLQAFLDTHGTPDLLILFAVTLTDPRLFGPPIVLARQAFGAGPAVDPPTTDVQPGGADDA